MSGPRPSSRHDGGAVPPRRRPAVSVIVCTHNRAVLLPGLVEALVGQTLAADELEIVIVDNASADDTPRVLADLARRWPGRLVTVAEPAPGHTRARNAGIAVARGDVLAFTDDDVVPDAGWAETISSVLAGHPHAVGVVGTVRPRFAAPRPPWLHDRLLPALSVWSPARPGVGVLTRAERPVGANMAFRRELFDRIGGFDPALGNRGRTLSGADDREIVDRARSVGTVLTCSDAGVDHLLDAAVLERSHLLRLATDRGCGARLLTPPTAAVAVKEAALLMALAGVRLVARLTRREALAFWCRFKVAQKRSYLRPSACGSAPGSSVPGSSVGEGSDRTLPPRAG